METQSHCCEVDHAQHQAFEQKTNKWDKLGVLFSSLCALHCLLTPLLIVVSPFLGEIFEQAWVHTLLALFVAPVGVYAFTSGYRHHKNKWLMLLGLSGVVLVVTALLMNHEHSAAPRHGFELDYLTVAGSLILVGAHLWNRKACQCHVH